MSQLLTEVDKVSELSSIPSDRWATVISIVPFEIQTKKPGLVPGFFRIPPSKNGVPSICHIPICRHFVYIDEDRGSLGVENSPEKVAKAIVFDYINAQIGTTNGAIPGITYVEGKLTLRDVIGKHQEELNRIKILQLEWFKRIVQMAKDDWTRYHQHAAISDIQRIIAMELNLPSKDNPWMDQSDSQASQCPACMENIKAGAKICRFCRTDLVEWAKKDIEPDFKEEKEEIK